LGYVRPKVSGTQARLIRFMATTKKAEHPPSQAGYFDLGGAACPLKAIKTGVWAAPE